MIDILPIRNQFRSLLLDAEIVDDSAWAWEGRGFNPGGKDSYIEEIVGVESDRKAATAVYGSRVVFTYNVYTRGGDSGGKTGTKDSYGIVSAIGGLFDLLAPFYVDDVVVTIDLVSRRISTEEKGWRLSPIDIVVRLEQLIGD